MNRNTRLPIRAEDRRREVQQSSPTGWKATTGGIDLSTVRNYMIRNTARRCTFVSA